MKRLEAVLITGLIIIIAGCGGQSAVGSLDSADASGSSLATDQAFNIGELPDAARQVSQVERVFGQAYAELSPAGTYTVGPFVLGFEPAADTYAWAKYAYSLPETDHLTGLDLYTYDLVGEYWIGLANYTEDRWDWRGPFDQDGARDIPLPQVPTDYVSATGAVAWVVLVEAGSSLCLSYGNVTADRITYIDVTGIGNIAVRITAPETVRYLGDGAPVVVQLNAFLNEPAGFTTPLPVTDIGMVQLSYLWPGATEPRNGQTSDGTFDFGGADCMLALARVLKFACGEIGDIDGNTIDDLCDVTVKTDNVGMYGFSHPGIAAINVLSQHGADLLSVDYLVSGEMPTEPAIIAKEFGYWEGQTAVLNPYYEFPADYNSDALDHYVAPVHWVENAQFPEGRPGLQAMPDWFYMADVVPMIYGTRAYSPALTCELVDNGQLTQADWPVDVANPLDVCFGWPLRSTNGYNPLFGTTWNNFDTAAAAHPDLKVLLVFAEHDHMQPMADKPHIHQAFDGCAGNGWWTRLNPDRSYAEAIDPAYGAAAFPDISANTGPMDWLQIEAGGYPNMFDGAETKTKMSLAAVAEMADRVEYNDWSANLAAVLN